MWQAAFASAALAAVGGRIAVGMRLGHPGSGPEAPQSLRDPHGLRSQVI